MPTWLLIGLPIMLVSWAVTALVIVRDIRRERREALDRLNIEYLILCTSEPA